MASTRHRTCIRTIRKVWIRTDVISAAVASCLAAVAEAMLPETEADPRLLGLELGRLAGQKDDTAAEVERQEEAARPRRRHPKGLQCGPGHLQGCEAGEHREDGRRQVQPGEQQRHSERELSHECQARSRCHAHVFQRGIADVSAARAVWLFGARLAARLAARSQPGAVRWHRGARLAESLLPIRVKACLEHGVLAESGGEHRGCGFEGRRACG
mmetsp:Transcript_132276/g.423180  ORF Transcript_132276/g.423180 Transcript_132276/m.423180 type:complete len:214 (+) Transcript_132276:383-1024(+)